MRIHEPHPTGCCRGKGDKKSYYILLSAAPLSDENLKVYGRALANYQVCARIAADLDDKTMLSYYSEMFNDSSVEINTYPKYLSKIVIKEFNRSVDKLSKIDEQSMGQLCLSRFDSLSRKMQKKKLLTGK